MRISDWSSDVCSSDLREPWVRLDVWTVRIAGSWAARRRLRTFGVEPGNGVRLRRAVPAHTTPACAAGVECGPLAMASRRCAGAAARLADRGDPDRRGEPVAGDRKSPRLNSRH